MAGPLARGIERVRAVGRSPGARRLAGAGVVLSGDRLWHRAAALGKTFLVQEVLREPVVFTDRFGVRYLLYPSDAVYESYLNDGYYERAEQTFCSRYVKPGMTVFDVGASHGYYTLLFAKLVREGFVHAFEAEAWNFHRLNTNLALNGVENVLARRAAIFERTGEVELNVFPHELYGWHTLGAPSMEVDGRPVLPAERQTVPALTLDGYCEEHEIERIDLLKLDVEGAEVEALRGADRLLREGRISCIVFEVSEAMVEGMGHEPADVVDLVRSTGLTVHELADDGTLRPAAGRPARNFQNFVALA
jgi:FkbM family methyltransferase